ncbi:hypothetical protein C5167_050522 [Papaver somniferum]|uniref:Uncharacterized protein n=1 Tax=Papaver somniferum TaxID=3469 RepID=A0A4Y7KNW8_PAPSO|nr:hypothetical protein C5167_050522 [Papaver somniferum]
MHRYDLRREDCLCFQICTLPESSAANMYSNL